MPSPSRGKTCESRRGGGNRKKKKKGFSYSQRGDEGRAPSQSGVGKKTKKHFPRREKKKFSLGGGDWGNTNIF